MLPLIKPQDLLALTQKQEIILIDARSGPTAKDNYTTLHLKGALYVDLEEDLASKSSDAAQGGRHPLPSISKFAQLLGKLGIDPESHVVVYDGKSGANAASHFWWMLTAAGHKKVQVLDGGMQAAQAIGFPTSAGIETPTEKADYPSSSWQLPIVDLDQVEKASKDKAYLIIDVREPQRYRGEKEPIDLIAGHIPQSVNIPFTTNLESSGYYLSAQELKSKYQQALNGKSPEKVIVHCGSGVTACHTLLAMAYAGLELPNLYVGSWSEWSRRDLPIAKETE